MSGAATALEIAISDDAVVRVYVCVRACVWVSAGLLRGKGLQQHS